MLDSRFKIHNFEPRILTLDLLDRIVGKYSVLNCTRQTLIASELEVTETAWSPMKGLLGRSSNDFTQGKGLLVSPAEGIHTIGMTFAIDVAYLDAQKRVIRVYHKLAPYRIAAIQLGAESILELPAGVLARSHTQVGDLLQFLAQDE
jgi:uncharacterized protein